MLSLEDFKKSLKERNLEEESRSDQTEFELVAQTNDENLFHKLRNDILGPQSILRNLVDIKEPTGKFLQRKDIDKEFPKGEESGQWLEDDREEGLLITWNSDIINLYQRKQKETGEEEMPKKVNEMNYEEPPQDIGGMHYDNPGEGEIGSVEQPLIDRDAVESAAYFMVKNPDMNVGELAAQACVGAASTEDAIENLRKTLPSHTTIVSPETKYGDEDLQALNDYRVSLRQKMFRDVLRTEPPGLEDMPGQPGVYGQQRNQSHVDDGLEEIPQNDEGVFVAEDETIDAHVDAVEKRAQASAAQAKASQDEAKAAEEAAQKAKERLNQMSQAANSLQSAAGDESFEESYLNEADEPFNKDTIAMAMVSHPTEKIKQALDILKQDREAYFNFWNDVDRSGLSAISKAMKGVITGDDDVSQATDDDSSKQIPDEKEEVAGEFLSGDSEEPQTDPI